MYKGVFWFIGGRIVSVKVACRADGAAAEACVYSSKSGDNFNHRAEWEKLPRAATHGKPFDFFPRGRVEIKNGAATVWLNPTLNEPKTLSAIKSEFRLDGVKTAVKADGSEHYRFGGEK